VFSNALAKPFPKEAKDLNEYLELKEDLVLSFQNFSEIRDNKSEWVNIAKYIGEIRAQINTNFVRKPVSRNFINPGSELSSDQINQLRLENENNEAANRSQDLLQRCNTILTFQLMANAKRFPANSSTNVDFTQKIIAAAHLNADEQKELHQ
jgi:hypothetical protein